MQRTPTATLITAFALALAPFALGGCQGAMWGNMFALGVTFSLFFGTLQLGRRPASPRVTSEAPSATRTVS